ncbi:Cof-type HAD-IIB family hydrolase [Brochothrix campestris]|uniref:HAD phosphatase superfamily protein n=1 Tax=Brochothrix campestris FSL F6-1037 TaxID=1265861 RepID=W7CYD7_9LIST|nr:Cof-type HAD-IIB family hydrolase [Brochothrix campestris]EUJ38033.1 HAD phosphatase superfamily protein [Brochothrix campestris FSL F6-1037]
MTLAAIILDMDGTLLNEQQQISEETRKSLIAAQQQGMQLVLASGRPTKAMFAYAAELQMDRYDGLLVSYNGSKVTDYATKAVLFDETIAVPTAKAVLEHLKQFDVKVMIERGDYIYVNDVYNQAIQHEGTTYNVFEHEARSGDYRLCEAPDLAVMLDFDLNKIVVAAEQAYLLAHHEAIYAPFKESLNAMFTAPFYFEFTAQHIDKAAALAAVLEPRGITPAQMVAFGDGLNDVSMLTYVGTGVAMGNAVAELKEIATTVTKSNNEDGIAQMLLSLLACDMKNKGQ